MRSTKIKDGRPVMTEKLFMQRIIQGARVTGWMVYHTFNAYRSAKGFPDLTLLHPGKGRLMFVEVKTDTGKVTLEQQEWLDALMGCQKVQAYVVRPEDWEWFWEELKR